MITLLNINHLKLKGMDCTKKAILLFVFVLWFAGRLTMADPIVIPRRVRCRSPAFPSCFDLWYLCPIACPSSCVMDCVACKPVCSCNFPGAVCEDPKFVGGDGITFYFHGRKNQDFCLVSDPNLHINAHFIGKRNPNLKRDFTWVQSLGIMFDNYKIYIAAKPTSTWNDNIDRLEITFDNNPISLPEYEGSVWNSDKSPNVMIARTGSHVNRISLEVVNNFKVVIAVVPISAEESRIHGYGIVEEDCFAHLEVGFKFYNMSNAVDGVLGQTYRLDYVSKMKANVMMPVMGGLEKYSSSGIFATDCLVSRFNLEGVEK